MNRAEYLEKCKTVRAWIGENPGHTHAEIEAATGIVGTLMALTMKRLVRAEGRPPKYYIELQ